eukprot:Protomagalhaensia_wolfi_Nauph_80__5634@NODE_64_length_4083_cov_335_176558_g37_i1_p7_GENE_NODE_64_length_4083_cov_335_176558_g37_i1NODE_64_length_4083_cov_335_176558_g37_i1_p7_ORF_typecomplete_len128_score6_90_NODE_64_length_4083_cov_335_176558_g37_i127453128
MSLISVFGSCGLGLVLGEGFTFSLSSCFGESFSTGLAGTLEASIFAASAAISAACIAASVASSCSSISPRESESECCGGPRSSNAALRLKPESDRAFRISRANGPGFSNELLSARLKGWGLSSVSGT